MANITQIVSLSDAAFFTIVTSALEAYSVCHQDDKMETHVPVETYGNLWGYQATTTRNESVLHVVLADSDVSARRDSGSASPADDAFGLKVDFADCFFPTLEYLGDFHSHPYDESEFRTELELQRNVGHTHSRADRNFAKHQQRRGRPYRLQVIATVFERSDAINRQSGHLDGDLSCIRFRYDKHTIWIKVYAYRINAEDRTSRKVKEENVALICPCAGVTVGAISA